MPDSDTDSDREEYLSRLGVVLELARRAAGYTQEKAAIAMGVNVGTFTRWENGTNGIGSYDLVRLVRLYGFDPDLAVNPPASKIAIRRRLSPVAEAARRAVIRALEAPMPEDDDAPA